MSVTTHICVTLLGEQSRPKNYNGGRQREERCILHLSRPALTLLVCGRRHGQQLPRYQTAQCSSNQPINLFFLHQNRFRFLRVESETAEVTD